MNKLKIETTKYITYELETNSTLTFWDILLIKK